MATAKTTRPAKLTVSLCLAIDHQAYSVTPIRAEDPDVRRRWRLEKKGGDGAVYDVATTIHGHQCDCPDWETRRNGLDPLGCKHVRACVQMGLLEDSAPVTPPLPEPLRPIPDPIADRWTDAHPYRNELAPAPCCSPGESAPCVPCQTTTPAIDASTAAVAKVKVNERAELVKRYENEAPELDPADDHDIDDAAETFGALDARRHLDRSERLTLAELVERQVEFYEGWRNAAGTMFAAALGELLMKVKLTNATTPAELDGRVAALEADVRESWEAAGYEAGRLAGCRCGEVVLN